MKKTTSSSSSFFFDEQITNTISTSKSLETKNKDPDFLNINSYTQSIQFLKLLVNLLDAQNV